VSALTRINDGAAADPAYCLPMTSREPSPSGSEALFRAVENISPDAIVTIDHRGHIQSFSPAAERLFGYGSAEVVGQNVKLLMPPRYRDRHDQFLANYLATGERHIIGIGRVVTGERKDGSTFPMEILVDETVVAGERVFVGFIRHLTDLEHQHRRVQELQSNLFHVNRLTEMGQMASSLAHEINQPLAAIINYAKAGLRSVAAGDAGPAADVAGVFERIEKQAWRAADIIKRLRSFVRRGETAHRAEDLAELVDEALALALVGPAAHGIRLETAVAADIGKVMVDRVQIQQVLVNLVRNAIDAMADVEDRAVTIAAGEEGFGFVRISVSDRGPGIPPQLADQLFSAFVTTKDDGIGVGLCISQAIVEAHGGRIWFTQNPAAGVTFHYTVPLAQAEREDAQP